jgi:hypothetical protein
MSPKVLSDGVVYVPNVGEKSLLWGWACCDDVRAKDVWLCSKTPGEAAEKGECRLRRRSASETETGSGDGRRLLLNGGGGGMEAWLKRIEEDGEARTWCVDSNLMGGTDMRDAIEGCELAGGGGWKAVAFETWVLLPLFSELYITATFVDGEFMVPVRDHPMATYC